MFGIVKINLLCYGEDLLSNTDYSGITQGCPVSNVQKQRFNKVKVPLFTATFCCDRTPTT